MVRANSSDRSWEVRPWPYILLRWWIRWQLGRYWTLYFDGCTVRGILFCILINPPRPTQPSRPYTLPTLVGLVRTGRTYSYSVQFPDSNQCLFGKYYALHDVTYDSGYCVEWRDERTKLQCWQQQTALCVLQRAKRRKSPSCWVRSWIQRRGDSGFDNTPIRELKCEDTTEYKSVFRMDKESFKSFSLFGYN